MERLFHRLSRLSLDEDYTLFFTAESAQKPMIGGGQLALSTSGLDTITLVDPQIAVGDAPR